MILIILVIGIGSFFISIISENKNFNQNLGGNFILMDHRGSIFNSNEITKKKLIYFGYTYCPDICPMDMLRISNVFDQNPELKKELLPIFITVDPLRDDPKTLNDFIGNFNKAFVGLTGTEKEINDIIKSFKIYVNYNKANDEDLSYLVDHSSLIFIVDENDRFLGLLRPNEINFDKIKRYLKEVI